jgi:cell division protein FtsB
MNGNQSVAYDFSYFDQTENLPRPEKKAEPRRAAKKGASIRLRTIASFVLVIAVLGCIVVNYVQLTETNAKLNSLKKSLTAAQESEKRLNVEMEKKTSLKNIEERARNELGMAEVQSYQVEYVSIAHDDKIEILKPANEGIGLNTIVDGISQSLNAVLEYLS